MAPKDNGKKCQNSQPPLQGWKCWEPECLVKDLILNQDTQKLQPSATGWDHYHAHAGFQKAQSKE